MQVTSAIPPASFSPVERPLTTFGRSSVLMRAPGHKPLQHAQQRQYIGGGIEAAQQYNAPPPPFFNQRSSAHGSNIVRFMVAEPELCKLDLEAALKVRRPEGTILGP